MVNPSTLPDPTGIAGVSHWAEVEGAAWQQQQMQQQQPAKERGRPKYKNGVLNGSQPCLTTMEQQQQQEQLLLPPTVFQQQPQQQQQQKDRRRAERQSSEPQQQQPPHLDMGLGFFPPPPPPPPAAAFQPLGFPAHPIAVDDGSGAGAFFFEGAPPGPGQPHLVVLPPPPGTVAPEGTVAVFQAHPPPQPFPDSYGAPLSRGASGSQPCLPAATAAQQQMQPQMQPVPVHHFEHYRHEAEQQQEIPMQLQQQQPVRRQKSLSRASSRDRGGGHSARYLVFL